MPKDRQWGFTLIELSHRSLRISDRFASKT
jgi:hypothetical protein